MGVSRGLGRPLGCTVETLHGYCQNVQCNYNAPQLLARCAAGHGGSQGGCQLRVCVCMAGWGPIPRLVCRDLGGCASFPEQMQSCDRQGWDSESPGKVQMEHACPED